MIWNTDSPIEKGRSSTNSIKPFCMGLHLFDYVCDDAPLLGKQLLVCEAKSPFIMRFWMQQSLSM